MSTKNVTAYTYAGGTRALADMVGFPGLEGIEKAPGQLRTGVASVAAPHPTGAHKRRPYEW